MSSKSTETDGPPEAAARRIIALSDTHCGHRAGLTPPGWQYAKTDSDYDRRRFGKQQRILWDWYAGKIAEVGLADVLIFVGDAIEGKGLKSGGTELLEADRIKQVEMAAECLSLWGAKTTIMVYGTAYHTGAEEDFEAILAGSLGAIKIGSHEWVDVGGLIFDVKHKTSSSIIPHGRATGPYRDALWNALWAERQIEPRAAVFLRGHVHYFVHVGDARQIVFTLPMMEGFGGKYGTREMSGTVDIGFLEFNVRSREDWSWRPHLLDMRPLAPQVVKA